MADLIDRIQGTDETRPKIPSHQFVAALSEYARGKITRIQFSAAFDFQGTESTQATVLADAIDTKNKLVDKLQYVEEIANVVYLAETPELGLYDTKAKIKTRLGL